MSAVEADPTMDALRSPEINQVMLNRTIIEQLAAQISPIELETLIALLPAEYQEALWHHSEHLARHEQSPLIKAHAFIEAHLMRGLVVVTYLHDDYGEGVNEVRGTGYWLCDVVRGRYDEIMSWYEP